MIAGVRRAGWRRVGGRLGLDKAWWTFFLVFPECPILALGKGLLPRVPGKALGEVFLFFFVFLSHFFVRPSHII